jgi:hypothetical protein
MLTTTRIAGEDSFAKLRVVSSFNKKLTESKT